MNLSYEQTIMLQTIKEKPGLGKTALMKIMFFLKQIFQVDLSYDFDIYTYGPYSSGVTEVMDDLKDMQLIDIQSFESKGFIGYNVSLGGNGEQLLKESSLKPEDERTIKEVIDIFGSKLARDLELDSTIVFIYESYKNNQLTPEKQSIVDAVQDIKPHFKKDQIEKAFDDLQQNKMLR